MKNINILLSSVFVAAAISAAAPPEASAQWFRKRDTTATQAIRKTKKQLQKENDRMATEIDSLKCLLNDYISRQRHDDSVRSEIIDIFEENEGKIGAGLTPDDYNDEVTDSLLNILWHLHRKATNSHEGEGYDMDAVHFSSNVPDKVFLDRISNMNSYITLPYNETVRNFIILYSEKMPRKMAHMLSLSKYYFPIFESILNKYDMPEELKYMAVIESALNPLAVSRAGAKGMWQFMYNTGKIYGLKINSFVDERLDVEKSADAAARYLKDAYSVFGDWSLAISAYNCGSGNVMKAIRRSGKRDFWSIYDYLPRETRGYVPAFVGAMYAFTYYKEHGIVPDKIDMPDHIDTLEINKQVHFRQISEVADIPMDVLHQLNPQYVHEIIPGNECKYILRLPYKYTGSFVENEDSIYTYKASEIFNPTELQKLNSSSSPVQQRIVYKVKRGDSLGKIASRNHVTVSQLKSWNHLKSSNIKIGQRIVIYKKSKYVAPVTTVTSQNNNIASNMAGNAQTKTSEPEKTKPAYTTYTVKSGDTLYEIAKRYPGVSAKDIMNDNNISSKIRPGMKLKIPKK